MLFGIGSIASSMLQTQALDASTRDTEDRVANVTASTIAPVMGGVDLSQPLGDGQERRLDLAVSSTVADDAVARIRIFSDDGTLVYSTDDGDRIGTKKVGDPGLITAAVGGATASVVGGDEVAARDGTGSVSSELLQVYTPVSAEPTTAAQAVLQMDHRYAPLADRAATPWAMVRIGALGGAAVMVMLAFANIVQWIAGRRQAARSGFNGDDEDGTEAREGRTRAPRRDREAGDEARGA